MTAVWRRRRCKYSIKLSSRKLYVFVRRRDVKHVARRMCRHSPRSLVAEPFPAPRDITCGNRMVLLSCGRPTRFRSYRNAPLPSGPNCELEMNGESSNSGLFSREDRHLRRREKLTKEAQNDGNMTNAYVEKL